jgi:hypothetical protein
MSNLSVQKSGLDINNFFTLKERVRSKLESYPYLPILILLVGFYFSWPLAYKLFALSENIYSQPIILVAALKVFPVQAVLVITIVLLLLNYTSTSWNRFYSHLNWKRWNDDFKLRGFIVFVALILAWAFSTYEFNSYYGQPHYFDRIFLIVLALLIWINPIFVFPFITFAITLVSQFEHPNVLQYSWTDKRLIFDTLILFTVFVFLNLIFKVSPLAFVFLAFCLQAAHYFIPSLAKIQLGNSPLDWLNHNQLHLLFVSSYVNGWLGFLTQNDVLSVARLIKEFNIPLQFITLVSEAGFLFILVNRRVATVLLIGAILLHIGICVSSGIFFWKWILLDIAFLLLIRQKVAQQLFTLKFLVLSIILIVFSEMYFHPTRLAWFDTRVNNMFELEAVDEKGYIFDIPRGFFAPYDLVFAQNRFPYLSQERLLVGTFGAVSTFEQEQQINSAQLPTDLNVLKSSLGINRYDPDVAEEFDAFIIRVFTNVNSNLQSPIFLPSILRPPHHITIFASENPYNRQYPVVTVRVKFIETYYDDSQITLLSEKIIREIGIPPP